MNAQAWIALGVLVLAIAGLLFNAGKHAQKLETHERDIDTLKTKTDALGQETSGITILRELLEEVRQDVKGLIGGRRNSGGNP